MTDLKKGDDAGDHAPKPVSSKPVESAKNDRQDALNYDNRKDGGQAVPVEDMNSANDE